VFAALVLIVPAIILALCPLTACANGCLWVSWLFIAMPLTMMLAYGGGLLCYVPGPVILLVPLLGSIVGLVASCANFACCGTCCTAFVSVLVGFLRIFVGFLTVFAVLPASTTCFGLDLYTTFSEVIPPCFPVSPILIDRGDPAATIKCGGFLTEMDLVSLPAIINCADTTSLGETRFKDGLDNIMYIIEQIRPGTNEELYERTVDAGLFSFLAPYAEAHTTAAHESGGDLTNTCFWITTPSILLSLLVLLFQLFVVLTLAGLILLVLSFLIFLLLWAGYVIWLLLDLIKTQWIRRYSTNGAIVA